MHLFNYVTPYTNEKKEKIGGFKKMHLTEWGFCFVLFIRGNWAKQFQGVKIRWSQLKG